VHEVALVESVMTAIEERLGSVRVLRVRVEVGRLFAVMPEAMQFAWESCARATGFEDARLELEMVAGQELRIREVEVE
jgi:hydrogenase nickel incorporation protein HypA/HybF